MYFQSTFLFLNRKGFRNDGWYLHLWIGFGCVSTELTEHGSIEILHMDFWFDLVIIRGSDSRRRYLCDFCWRRTWINGYYQSWNIGYSTVCVTPYFQHLLKLNSAWHSNYAVIFEDRVIFESWHKKLDWFVFLDGLYENSVDSFSRISFVWHCFYIYWIYWGSILLQTSVNIF